MVRGSISQGFTYDYEFAAVYGNGEACEENKKFWKWTPNGKLTFGCTAAKDMFVPGEEYYLDLTACNPIQKLVE